MSKFTSRIVLACVATLLLTSGTISAQPRPINSHVADFDVKNPRALVASQMKALFQARDFVQNSSNKLPTKLAADYFKTNIKKRWDLGDGESQAIEQVGNAGPLIPSLIVATAMQEVNAVEVDDTKLLPAWLNKQSAILAAMNQGAPVSILPDEETKKTWELFLDAWVQEAATKSELRNELKSAPYEFLKAMLEDVAGLTIDARPGPAQFPPVTVAPPNDEVPPTELPLLLSPESAEAKLAAAKKWSETVTYLPKCNSLVVEIGFFQEHLLRGPKPLLQNTETPLREALALTESMTATAGMSQEDSWGAKRAWSANRWAFCKILEDSGQSDTQILAWIHFLDAWQEEVERINPGRFREALLQAGSILSGLLLEYSPPHIEAALTNCSPELLKRRFYLPQQQEQSLRPQEMPLRLPVRLQLECPSTAESYPQPQPCRRRLFGGR